MTIVDYPLELPDVSITMSNLPEILTEIFPSWIQENISVKPVSGGITNMLIKCTHVSSKSKDVVLARSYGNNTSLIIDRNSEFSNHLKLNKLNLAPNIYAKLSNGIIYGYLSGRSLTPEELSNKHFSALISQKLGYWHTVITESDSCKPMQQKNDLWGTIFHWIDIAPKFTPEAEELIYKIGSLSGNCHFSEKVKQILKDELQWLYKTVGGKSRLVNSHCDLLSGNIVIPPELDLQLEKYGNLDGYLLEKDIVVKDSKYDLKLPKASKNTISFIDYEYMLCAPRGFDIANHLAEWQGFECDKLRILKPFKGNVALRRWCYAYVVGTLQENDDEDCVTDSLHSDNIETEIDELIDEIYFFFGLPGFYWGIWSAIQDKISTIDFDYGGYCVNRLEEYYAWKKEYLAHHP